MGNWKNSIMKKQSSKVIFFGSEDFSVSSLEKLIEDGWDIRAIVTKPDSRRGRGQKLQMPAVKAIGLKNNIDIWQPNNLLDIKESIAEVQNRIGVLVSYGKIVPKEILDLFAPIGIVNLHPSLLPKYRGPSPIESPILNGDAETGVSFIKLTDKMDAGPIYYQKKVKLSDKSTRPEMFRTLSEVGAIGLASILPEIISGKCTAKKQDEKQASYTKMLLKSDGIINWDEPAEAIEKKIRAYQGWPKARTSLGSIDLSIVKAYSVPSNSGKPGNIAVVKETGLIGIDTSKGTLYIQELQPAGKSIMSSSEFIRGYGSKITKIN